MTDLRLYRATATASATLTGVAAWQAVDAYRPDVYLLAMLVMALVCIVSLRAIATHHEWADDVAEYETRRAATGPRSLP